jgi:hypothetical protein
MFGIPPLEERPLSPGYNAPLTFLAVVIFLSLPAHRLRSLAFLSLIPLGIIALTSYTTGSIPGDYWATSSAIGWIIYGVDFIVLSDPERDFWRVGRAGEGEKKQWKGMG